MDETIRKLMTMHKALHLRDNIDYIYQENKDEEDTPLFRLEASIKKKQKKTFRSDQTNDNIIKTSDIVLWKNMPPTLFERVACEGYQKQHRERKDRKNNNK